MPAVDTNNQPGSSNGSTPGPEENQDDKNDRNFECNICLDQAKDAVISLCGHLFCWPCVHQWLETRPNNKTCPVCKSALSKEKCIPLYGRGSDSKSDPREKAPPRPSGQRSEPEQQNNFMNGFGFGGEGGGGFQFHLGVGAFPFGFFTLINGRPGQNQIPAGQLEGDRLLSTVYTVMGVFFLLWLIFV